jgi:hypothetical protein
MVQPRIFSSRESLFQRHVVRKKLAFFNVLQKEHYHFLRAAEMRFAYHLKFLATTNYVLKISWIFMRHKDMVTF